MRLVKLVRDNIVQYLDAEGGIDSHTHVNYLRVGPGLYHIEALRKKLLEEAAEYLINPCAGELADVMACHALAVVDLGMEPREVERIRLAQRAERGGFDHGVGMYVGD